MITPEQIQAVIERVRREGPNDEVVKGLRAEHSGIHFTFCSDDDVIGPTPAHEEEGFCLYLIDGRNECIRFSTDAQTATGLVVAEVEPEETI